MLYPENAKSHRQRGGWEGQFTTKPSPTGTENTQIHSNRLTLIAAINIEVICRFSPNYDDHIMN
uniref:Uncharacterized protein n=1 Tax=Lutzomyia longipalpis TaxID=7200 RepID=A0A1B0CDP0_LUTLO